MRPQFACENTIGDEGIAAPMTWKVLNITLNLSFVIVRHLADDRTANGGRVYGKWRTNVRQMADDDESKVFFNKVLRVFRRDV